MKDLEELAASFAATARGLRDEYLASPEEGGILSRSFRRRSPLARLEGEWQDRSHVAALPFRAALAEAEPGRIEPDEARIAFWANAYNAFAALSVVELGVRDRIERQPDFFYRTVAYAAGRRICLEDIEHGILRGNRSPPGWPFRPFGRRDSRAAWAVREPDSRVVFVLDRCVASSPEPRVLSSATLRAELAEAESAYAAGYFLAYPESRTLACSRLFREARADFPGRWLDDPAYSGWKSRLLPYDGRVAPSRRAPSGRAPSSRAAGEGAAAP